MKFSTPYELADLCRVSVDTINREIKRGKLGVHRFGDRVLISDSQLERYLKLCRQDSNRKFKENDAINS